MRQGPKAAMPTRPLAEEKAALLIPLSAPRLLQSLSQYVAPTQNTVTDARGQKQQLVPHTLTIGQSLMPTGQ